MALSNNGDARPEGNDSGSATDRSLAVEPRATPSGRGARPALLFLHFLHRLEYIPKGCRWDPKSPPPFNLPLCFLFAFSAAFTVSNLYYNHPILNVLAKDFGVSYETASQVPTLMQAGYAIGLVFICPLGDVFRRRPLTLLLIFATANIWLGLCITRSFDVFRALSFLAAITTVTPQLMLPLVGELAPANRRAMMISILFAGIFLGILLARVLSGLVTEFASWRVIYYAAFGLQYVVLGLIFCFFPDYPSTNPDGISYVRMLWTLIRIPMRQPLLVETSVLSFFNSAVFVSFWTTLTFQLASAPFRLSTLAIGLFALIGMPPFVVNPQLSDYLLRRLLPAYVRILGQVIMLVGILVGTYAGTVSLAGPVIMGLLVDLGFILSQTACRTQLIPVEPAARNRVNTVFITAGFFGMLMGTAVGNSLYARGGWRCSGAADIGFAAAGLLACILRGPHETRWVGWRGGWRDRPSFGMQDGQTEIAAATGPQAAEAGMFDVEKGEATNALGWKTGPEAVQRPHAG